MIKGSKFIKTVLKKNVVIKMYHLVELLPDGPDSLIH